MRTTKNALQKYEKVWKKIKNIIRSTGNSSSNYDEKSDSIQVMIYL